MTSGGKEVDWFGYIRLILEVKFVDDLLLTKKIIKQPTVSQKQSYANDLQNSSSSKIQKFLRNTPVLETFLGKLQICRPVTLLNGDPNKGVFLWNLQNF